MATSVECNANTNPAGADFTTGRDGF